MIAWQWTTIRPSRSTAPTGTAGSPHHAHRLTTSTRFRRRPAHLSGVVRFDRPRLGDIAGLDVVHLQCHIGTDTLSLARLGARITGLDFSAPALDVARRLAADAGAAIDYVESEVYDARRGARRRALRPRLHRHRRVVLAARRRAAGPTSWPHCCAPAVGCSCAKGTRCCGRSPTRGPTASSPSSTRTSRRAARRSTTRRPTSSTTARWGIRGNGLEGLKWRPPPKSVEEASGNYTEAPSGLSREI